MAVQGRVPDTYSVGRKRGDRGVMRRAGALGLQTVTYGIDE